MILIILLLLCLIGLVVTGSNVGWGPFAFLKYNKKPILLSDVEFQYTIEELWIENKIYGKLYKVNETKRPIVILSHGYNGSNEYNKFIAKSLAKSGINVYAFDFRGGGTKSKSDGSPLNMSLMSEKDDLNNVIDCVEQLDFVDTNNIFLLGESQGGCVSALVAALKNDIKGLILYFPAFCIPEDANKRFENISNIPETDKPFNGLTIGKKYYEDILNLDIYKEIARYKGPVLLLHGTNDHTVAYSYSVKANEVYKDSRLIKFENDGHGFNSKNSEKALAYAYEFIREHLR